MDGAIFVGKGEREQNLALRYANRHGLIAGATGTGKTVTLQILAEGFSKAGVPVFAADIKGDLSGLAEPGEAKPFLLERASKIGLADYAFQPSPVVFWDLFGEAGHPIRTSVTEIGPVLLSHLLELNDVQEGVMNIAFKVADEFEGENGEKGLPLLDLKDLRAMLAFLSEHADDFAAHYGNVSKASVAAIQRALLVLENQGADKFLGEPALALSDFMRTDPYGRGQINILAADKLSESPRLYATFLLWLLSELFEELPEVGDPEKPKLVFFFDEAHLLFNDAPKPLLEKVTQVVRLIRSKGVGVFFVTQNPQDIPDMVGSQLGNRVQHALRAFTPKEQRAVAVAAETFRANPAFKTEDVITELAVGEALTSFLGEKGVPGIVERTLIRPPASRIGPVTPEERQRVLRASPLLGRYDQAVDRDSAFERLRDRAAKTAEAPAAPAAKAPAAKPASPAEAPAASSGGGIFDMIFGSTGRRQSVGEAFTKSVVRTVGSTLGREIIRGVLGGILKSK
ncbi:MAG: DUF853 family protein [Alphaproteobacteria bacterium]|nr:DUF853 family protein [Alphaproteobacteria bacterium]